jgi:hypothetical protein
MNPMKIKKLLIAACFGLTAGLTIQAAENATDSSLAALSDKKASMSDKVTAIDAYVRGVEKSATSLTHKETKLSDGELKNATDEKWTKIHTYSDGAALKRMKMYPGSDSKKTEEFYYHDNKPVFVFVEENGAGKENHDANAVGDKFYFAGGTLIAAMSSNGKAMDMKSADVTKMSGKLQKESTAFRSAVK